MMLEELLTDTSMTNKTPLGFRELSYQPGIYIIVGGYGSGKSEVAVNLARYLVHHRENDTIPVAIADLDIVNPYFRSREAIIELSQLGIKAIVPQGAHFHADLPIIVPEIKGAVQENNGYVVLDVGGDDVGARVLSSLAGAFHPDEYELLLVLNKNRPFTSTVDLTLKLINEIETSSRLKFTGLISNTHLMDDTTAETIYDGITLTKAVSDKTGLPVNFISFEETLLPRLDKNRFPYPVLPLNRSLLTPWERKK